MKSNEANLFKVLKANEWIEISKTKPIPKMLFSEFWFEGELCILFADTNVGKSILAVQIADSISKGISIEGFKLESYKQPVLYFDFELSEKQFENRYSISYTDHYQFDDNLIRVEIDPDHEIPHPMKFEEFLYNSLEKALIENNANVLIIDNITYLSDETEKAKTALPLMKQIKALKSKYNLSILALAHTPKRDASKPLDRNDLQGSKMLINFCDSAFAIGESYANSGLRYVKQIKARNTEKIYNEDNVPLFEICKKENFLQFKFLKYSTEAENLKIRTDEDESLLQAQIHELRARGLSYREIGKQLNVNHMKVKRVLESA